jgi:hypothetical protein
MGRFGFGFGFALAMRGYLTIKRRRVKALNIFIVLTFHQAGRGIAKAFVMHA